MPPKAARADPDIVYRSETPLRQKKFPNRRRTIRSSAAHTPAPLRQQSTLTQQPTWNVSRSPPTAEDEDEVEDEDQDYEEDELEKARPRRKKRKSEADGKRQTTMTQYVPSSFIGERYDGAADLLLQFIPDDSFDGVRDSQSQLVLDSHDSGPQAGMQALVDNDAPTVADGDVTMQRDEENHSQKTQSSSDHGDERVDSAFPKQQSRPRPSPELPISAMTLRTPSRKFKSEIPSSNTPQSAIISICSTKSMRSPERSPLRNKSTNAFSQNHAAEDTRMSSVPESPTKPVSPFRLSPLRNRPTFCIPEKPPTLQHRSTIPDSEDTATQVTPFKQNKFRSQIPDTQMEMFGEEIAPITETQFPVDSYTQYAGGTYYAENDYDYNFDPVCSALDRDAARFMQTQLQRDRIGYDAFHKTRSFSQAEEDRAERTLEHKQDKSNREPELGTAQQSQELGDDLPAPTLRPQSLEQEFEDAPTQSPRSSPQQPPRVPYESDEIEEIDLSGDIVLPNTTIREVIQIVSSPNSKSVSSGKYPSSPPLVVENDARLRAEAEEQLKNTERHSSPPLPIILPIPPSQISTVGGTQLHHSLRRHTQMAAYVSSSPPPMPPSTSSPPPEARQHLKRFLAMYESDDEDEMDKDEPEPPLYDEDEDDMDLDFVPQRQHDVDRAMGSDNDNGSEDEGDHSRLEDILPDTLLDFSLPPPPTQSSVRSTRS
ncbi:hypothetical protein E4T50_15218 [Aureobasidium sp. EXF-12298]|nr:hypothetical protein E4T50_15218 [Aureobasidium sp. EXF-12298]KAI4752045.1 hypothetical protein E4T51_14778 [Aureobasidium sp. EXF-12344]KAI4769334.1 hypothetical protein E4T52_15612 [Aureobasidium sp. EXF-3400]